MIVSHRRDLVLTVWGGEQSIFSIIREVALLPFSKLFPSLGHNNIDEKFLKKVVK